MIRKFLVTMAFFPFLIGCGQSEVEGACVTLKMDEIPFFISEPIKYVELTYEDRILVHLSKKDSESLAELLSESEQLTVAVYFGKSYYDTVKVLGGEDYSVINLPYLDNAGGILSAEGIELK